MSQNIPSLKLEVGKIYLVENRINPVYVPWNNSKAFWALLKLMEKSLVFDKIIYDPITECTFEKRSIIYEFEVMGYMGSTVYSQFVGSTVKLDARNAVYGGAYQYSLIEDEAEINLYLLLSDD